MGRVLLWAREPGRRCLRFGLKCEPDCTCGPRLKKVGEWGIWEGWREEGFFLGGVWCMEGNRIM